MIKRTLIFAASLAVVCSCKNSSDSQSSLMQESAPINGGHQTGSNAGADQPASGAEGDQAAPGLEVETGAKGSDSQSVDDQVRYVYRNLDTVTASFLNSLQGLARGTAQTGRQGLAYAFQNGLITKEYAGYLLNEKLRPLYNFGKARGFKKTVIKAVLQGKLRGLCEQYAQENQMAL